jgi:acyl-CoA thioesterase-1
VPSRRAFLVAALALSAAAGCSRKQKMQPLPAGSTVLALGDSLTFGTGASAETSYPVVLARLTGWEVVNAGVPGDTAGGALGRLPALLQQHQPRLVIVSIGGNDFLRRVAPAETRAGIRGICEQAATSGAQVLLVAIPEVSAFAAAARSLADHALYRELATEMKIALHERGWSDVLNDPALRSDPIHANARGYEAFAAGLAARARELGLLAAP